MRRPFALAGGLLLAWLLLGGSVQQVVNSVAVGSITGIGAGVAALLGGTPSGTVGLVGTTSPTLITPNIGVATATSINLGDTALNKYQQGSWTPTDASGASLSLTINSAQYTRIGNFVFAQASVSYPSTVNGSNAVIGGLPVAAAAVNTPGNCIIGFTAAATLARMAITSGSSQVSLFTTAAGSVTNATMSLQNLAFLCIYPSS